MGVLLSASFLLLTASLGFAQRTSIRIPAGADDFDLFTFDRSRVSVGEVRHWIKFAKQGYYSSTGVSLSGCDPIAAEHTIKSLENVRKVRDELNSETNYPAELSPVVNHLRRLLPVREWMGEQYLAFVTSRKAPELVYQHMDIGACSAISERIRNEPKTAKACQSLGYDWTNCILESSSRQLGEYPNTNWKMFLDAKGIQEHLTLTADDE
jgi:hypothetical protein